jgi:cytochrome P450
VLNPKYVKYVLQKPLEFPKGEIQLSLLQPYMGNGLMCADGKWWVKTRKLIMPAFSNESIGEIMPYKTNALCTAMMTKWLKSIQDK